MFDTIAVVAYLIGDGSGVSNCLRLKALFAEKKRTVVQMQNVPSPYIKWHGVPPGANSLALIIKDAKISSANSKRNYYWVIYNLPPSVKELPYNSANKINKHNEAVNSWGQKNYHSIRYANTTHTVFVELYALDKRFSAREKITGKVLEQKIKNHVLTKAVIQG
ncbi:MAG: hypothetical protein A3E82_07990 [Gammaproteobacteria bacterium RIFCSPHIGHO2_12_FULL_38_11]|nr:MAG: hypothetical protein A3E82_07990 [Gammaproteobacteria bacterium RIFCSPHIGHO2_12_FULL_38_11]